MILGKSSVIYCLFTNDCLNFRLTLLLLQTLQETTSLPPIFQTNIFGLVDIGSREAAIHFVGTIIPDGPIQTGEDIHIRNQTIIVE